MATRVLVVGYGRRGRAWAGFLRRTRGLRAAGVVDVASGSIEAARSAGLRTFASVDDALSAEPWGAAVIASPPAHHEEHAVGVLEAGLPLLVEKPLALDPAAAARIARAASGRLALVGQNYRYMRRERAVRRALGDGAVGDPVRAEVLVATPTSHERVHGTHALWSTCVHHFDAFRSRFGSTPEEIRPLGPTDDPARFALELAWRSGLLLRYLYAEGAPSFHYHEWIEGTEAGISVEGQRAWVVTREPHRVRVPRKPGEDVRMARAFEGALRGEGEDLPTIADNLGTIALVEAAARAIASGSSVQLEQGRHRG